MLFPGLVAAAFGILFLRLWYFQVVESPTLVERADASRVAPVTRPAPRGLVFDRNGVAIATVRPEIVVTAVPNVVKKNPWVLDRVAQILGVGPEKLERKLKDAVWKPYVAAPIYVGADIRAGTKIAEDGQDLPGISVETEPMRYYPDSTSFTHVMGYVWTPGDDDVKRFVKAGKPIPGFVGKAGIERAYDSSLTGKPGAERVEIDRQRHEVRVESRDPAIPGDQLVLSLDARLQQFTNQLFKEKGFVGGAVAVDPRNGEVLCLVSSPTFDQALFSGGISDEEWRQLNDNPDKPQVDRAISGAYAPGSTFKIVTTVASALAGKFNPRTVYDCPGGFYRHGVHLKCLGVHGGLSFEEAFAKSCNTYFCNLGVAAGETAMREAAVDMGLGRRTGIEIGGSSESPGVVPTLKWLRLVSHKQNPPWYLGDTANLSVGQGYMATTPLQMANVVAMVANHGVSYKPHLVRLVRGPDGRGDERRIEPEVAHKIDLPKPFWEELQRALVGVVENGTARSARIPGLTWGGKTGSAEHGHEVKTHAWFVGFAPAEDPKIAICVLVESAGHGGDIAAPVAKEIVQRYMKSKPL
jgi:penicillin-binding protein 2